MSIVDHTVPMKIEIVTDPITGYVVAELTCGGLSKEKFWAKGYSFTHPEDEYDEAVGIDLATGRVLEAAGRELIKLANKEVNKKDKFKKEQKKASEKAVAARKEKTLKFQLELLQLAEDLRNNRNFKEGDVVKVVHPTLSGWGGRRINGETGVVKAKDQFFIPVVLDKDNGKPTLLYADEIEHYNPREDLPA